MLTYHAALHFGHKQITMEIMHITMHGDYEHFVVGFSLGGEATKSCRRGRKRVVRSVKGADFLSIRLKRVSSVFAEDD